MPDEEAEQAEHVFDQTNGALGPIDDSEQPSAVSERDLRRQQLNAQALGYISTGHA